MNKKLIISVLISILILGGIIFWASKENNSPETDVSGVILFYGDGCSHCVNVDKFIKDNNVKSKFEFTEKEVFSNKENVPLMAKKLKACGLPADNITVPMLWNGEKCLSGDEDIINYFKGKIGQ